MSHVKFKKNFKIAWKRFLISIRNDGYLLVNGH